MSQSGLAQAYAGFIEDTSFRREAGTMLPDLDRLHRSIEARKAQMLTHLGTLTEGERNTNSKAGEWSPLQVMEHVVTVEEWMAGPDTVLPPANAKVLLKGRLFMTFGVGIMRLNVRMPTLPMAEPRGDLDFTAIIRRWDAVRNLLLPRLEAVTPETQSLPIALHPVAGPLNAEQALGLLDVHLAYHLRHFPHLKSL